MIIRAYLFSIFSYSIIVKLSFGFYFPRFIEEKTLLNLINFHNEFLLFFIREIVRQRNKETLTIAVKIGCLFTNHQIFQFAFVIFFLIIFFNFKRISHISMIRQIGKNPAIFHYRPLDSKLHPDKILALGRNANEVEFHL